MRGDSTRGLNRDCVASNNFINDSDFKVFPKRALDSMELSVDLFPYTDRFNLRDHPQNHSPLSEPQGRASPSTAATTCFTSAADRLAYRVQGPMHAQSERGSLNRRSAAARPRAFGNANSRASRPRSSRPAVQRPRADLGSGILFYEHAPLAASGVLLLALRTSAAKQKLRRRSAWNRHFPRYRPILAKKCLKCHDAERRRELSSAYLRASDETR